MNQRSPRKTKSTRRPCPISIDCELVAAERGKVCPNRDYCESLAAPWNLPYWCSVLSDGTQVLNVDNLDDYVNSQISTRERYNAGWCSAYPLPFYYFAVPGFYKPVLIAYTVNGWHDESDWQEAKVLGGLYRMWAAARTGMNYQDFSRQNFDSDAFPYWEYAKLLEPDVNYPHCILPPDY